VGNGVEGVEEQGVMEHQQKLFEISFKNLSQQGLKFNTSG
jgi:hypothetical protein